MEHVTKQAIFDARSSEEIDSTKEPNLYLAKVAYDNYGLAIRDNSIGEIIALGREIEAGDS